MARRDKIMIEARIVNPDDYAWPWWQIVVVTLGILVAGMSVAMGIAAL
jgi:hypothetical protein